MTTKKKKSRKWLLPLLLVGIAVLAAVAVLNGKSKPKGTRVTVEEAELRTIDEKVSASGKIFPETEVKISSDVSGEIVALYIEEGDSVYAGQILAKIDPDTYISSVERGKASVNNAKANESMSGAQIESSKAQIEQINAQLINARAVHTRNTQLKNEGVISQVEFDQSNATLLGLEANLKAANASLLSAQKGAEGAAYTVKSAQAGLKELQTSLSRTTIKAPTGGIVSSLSIEQGERVVGTIQMAGTEMMRIANLSTMEVQVEVSENDILRVSVGDKVEIEVDAYLDRKFIGKVTEIANSANNISAVGAALNTDQVTNFIVKVRIDSDSYQDLVGPVKRYPFRPGMSASVDIFTESMENVLSIPIQAVTVREKEDEDNKKKSKNDDDYEEVVFVMEADTARMLKVTTGIQDDEYILVKSGLEEGMNIITGPYSAISKKLDEGDAVRIKKEKKDKDDDDDEESDD